MNSRELMAVLDALASATTLRNRGLLRGGAVFDIMA